MEKPCQSSSKVVFLHTMRIVLLFITFFVCSLFSTLFGQRLLTDHDQEPGSSWATEADSIEKEHVPYGLYAWRIGETFGNITPASPDTALYLFMNEAFSTGKRGYYSNTGNLGSPRYSRLFLLRKGSFNQNSFIFCRPYDYFLTQPQEFLFTNTKSPFTNLTYHSAGNRLTGEDRFRAIFATNVNKQLGLGFKVDYLYGRGEFAAQANSQFNVTFYGSYLGEKYDAHFFYTNNRIKNSENGGIENDAYITHPENFSTSFSTSDIPTRLSKTYNKMHVNSFFFTQKYKIGFRRYYDQAGNLVHHRTQQEGSKLLGKVAIGVSTDTAQLSIDSIQQEKEEELLLRPEFVPVVGLLHTLRLDYNNRQFISNQRGLIYGAENFLSGDSIFDATNHLSLTNTFALEVHEGFSKWVKSGLRLFATHRFERFQLPDATKQQKNTIESRIHLGAQLYKEQGSFFRYNVLGELRTSGADWGEFSIESNAFLRIPLYKDTLHITAFGQLRNEEPSFYYRHFHGKNAWWDNTNLSKIFHTRLGGTLSYKRYKATASVENIKNYTYFQEIRTATATPNQYLYKVQVGQHTDNIQVLTLSASAGFTQGIFNWETEAIYQLSSNKAILPLPMLNLYSNFYLNFKIAKVLTTNIGADIRFFTKYTGLTYSPIIGQYALQDGNTAIAIGNYPIINAYANFLLKRTRFYIMASHLNYAKGKGNSFLVPHHPLHGMSIRFGLSWNFVN